MSGTKVTPIKNAFYMSPDDMIMKDRVGEFHSEVFVLPDDNDAYQELMNDIVPFNPDSDKILNPYGQITKSTTAKGQIIIHIEYLVLKEEDPAYLKEAKKKAEEEGRGDDEEYIAQLVEEAALNGTDYKW